MGSSCTTSSKSSSKKNSDAMKKYSNTNDIKNNFQDKKKNPISKEVFEECFMRVNQLSNASTHAQLHSFNQAKTSLTQKSQVLDIMYTSKQKQQLGDLQLNQKELSPQSTNCPNMHSCTTSMKFDSPKTSLKSQKTSSNQLRRKISYIEIFILERKRYMQEKGVYNYTPYTVLPAPKLKKLQNNQLFKKRKSSLANIPQSVIHNDNVRQYATTQMIKATSINSFGSSYNEFSIQRKENTPAIMPQGDIDIIKIDI